MEEILIGRKPDGPMLEFGDPGATKHVMISGRQHPPESPGQELWFYRTFGAPALIHEVGYQTDRGLIREVATTATQGTMQILLDELERR